MACRLNAYLTASVVALVAITVPETSFGHGYILDSRSHLCRQGENSGCGAIQYEPQSVEGPDRFPETGPADGEIASGGNGRFSQLDEQTPVRWAKKPISAGNKNFTWHFTANHRSRDWRYFITKPDWNPSQPLSRSSFDLTPFCQYSGGNQSPPTPLVHNCNVPGGRTGYHIVLGVWDVGDTSNSFYQVVDVEFDGSNPPPVDPWDDVGDIQPTADLNLGDRVFTRVFDANGEINDASLQTEFIITNADDGDRLMWPYRLAERINDTQTDQRAGIKAADGTITPASGANDLFARDGSDITRIEIDVEEATPNDPYLALEGVDDEYTFEDGEPLSISFTVTAESGYNLMMEIFDQNGNPVTTANSDSSSSQHTLTIDQPADGTYTLTVKLLDGDEFIKQDSATFNLSEAAEPSDEYDYIYPDSISSYTAGTRVLGTDGNIYECKPWPYTGWCRGSGTYYAPGTGLAWDQAWILIGPSTGGELPDPVAEYTYPEGKGSYEHGTLVQDRNGRLYRCLIPGWCNGSSRYFSPGYGYAWTRAWARAD
jgi:chitin-binding protein